MTSSERTDKMNELIELFGAMTLDNSMTRDENTGAAGQPDPSVGSSPSQTGNTTVDAMDIDTEAPNTRLVSSYRETLLETSQPSLGRTHVFEEGINARLSSLQATALDEGLSTLTTRTQIHRNISVQLCSYSYMYSHAGRLHLPHRAEPIMLPGWASVMG